MKITLIENMRAVFYGPFYAACALGAYEAEGLQVDITMSPDAAKTMQTLLEGNGQVSWGGPLRLMEARQKFPGTDPVAFCEAIGRDPFFLIGREPNVRYQPADLLGQRLAVVTEVDTPWMCLQYDLKLAGIDPLKLKRTPRRTMADNIAAFKAGEVDVIQVFQPYAEALVQGGEGHLWYAAADRGPVSYTTLNTTRAFVERHPDVILGMCRAMNRVEQWLERNDGAALAHAIASYFPDVPQPLLAACYDRYKALGVWNRNPVVIREGFEWLRDAGLAEGRLTQRFEYEQCVVTRYAEQAGHARA
jgi:NitT/TauT family transport system substrate-binding protein